jgi:hypothetical protein
MRYARTGQNVIIPAEAVSDTSYLEYTSTVENLTAYGSDDGAESVALTGVTAVWDSGLGMFRITIPANQCPEEGHMFYVMVDWTGIIDIKAEFYMTNAETNINTLLTNITLANIKTQAAGALTDFNTSTPLAKTSDLTAIPNDIIDTLFAEHIDGTTHTTEQTFGNMFYQLYRNRSRKI